ncbi:hypothetical protein NC653_010349 [Populus alba x Populus x berolinensis]|uniref:Uncharacterized protein n=1 Tax=Populus alba x Populus x berolinensis TaxID=444605 RepID=A0AAD6QZK0_9ROSI|nr:hypothetical protein NC653_010349 [Populus alba x Populus x berolinensis]
MAKQISNHSDKHIDIRKTKLVPKHDATQSSTGARSTADSRGRRSQFQKRTLTKASSLAKAPLSFSFFSFLHVRLLLNIAVFFFFLSCVIFCCCYTISFLQCCACGHVCCFDMCCCPRIIIPMQLLLIAITSPSWFSELQVRLAMAAI